MLLSPEWPQFNGFQSQSTRFAWGDSNLRWIRLLVLEFCPASQRFLMFFSPLPSYFLILSPCGFVPVYEGRAWKHFHSVCIPELNNLSSCLHPCVLNCSLLHLYWEWCSEWVSDNRRINPYYHIMKRFTCRRKGKSIESTLVYILASIKVFIKVWDPSAF